MRKKTFLILSSLFLIFSSAQAASYQYLSPSDTKVKLEAEQTLLLVDIQVENEFNAHHLPGALATYAYPVKSDGDRAKLDSFLPQLNSSTDPVVIVCPRGGGGAKRAYDHLLSQGIEAERLFILEKGQKGWPYPEHLAKK